MLTGLILALLTGQSSAQVFPQGNGLSMSGVMQFDLHVQVASWQDMTIDPMEFRLLAQREFESRLKPHGIRRQSASRDYLVCKINALRTDNATIAYTTTLEFWGLRSTDVHTLLWENGGLGAVAAADFDADGVAGECADTFMQEWSKWNPSS
tara:strand:- start:1249 stop:1704 length:456 start_codon:yes stop_codon:yes gene_type:complete